MNKEAIAIIGGSGIYEVFDEVKEITVDTPYGTVDTINKFETDNKTAYFLPRHGPEHTVPPHLINYRANIYALFKLGVKKIFATNAVGSMIQEQQPGDFVIPNQFIDFTKNRVLTFYDGNTRIGFPDGEIKSGVVHLDYTNPYCSDIRAIFNRKLKEFNQDVHKSGVYVCTEGPRFETPAEIKFFQIIGGTIVGMTTVPEVILARELKMCYATVCLITNYAAGMQQKITHEEVIRLFDKKAAIINDIIKEIVTKENLPSKCDCIN